MLAVLPTCAILPTMTTVLCWAVQGVRVCVLLYREVSSVLPLDSAHSEEVLSSLHPNIHVVREYYTLLTTDTHPYPMDDAM